MLAQGRSRAARYAVAVAAVGVALLVGSLPASMTGEQAHSFLFSVAVGASALFGGLGPVSHLPSWRLWQEVLSC